MQKHICINVNQNFESDTDKPLFFHENEIKA